MRRLGAFLVAVSLGTCIPVARADASQPIESRLSSVLAKTNGRAAIVAVYGRRLVAAVGRDANEFSPLHLASVSKTLTAVAVMRLAERGDIALTAPIGTYLRGRYELNDEVAAQPVSAFLNHATGLRSNNLRAVSRGFTGWREYAEQAAAGRPSATVGRYVYSNDNYVLLTALVEVVAQRPFNVAIEQLVWDPLGVPGGHLDVTNRATQVLGGAGAWVASAYAVAVFFNALNPATPGKKLLSGEWLSRLHDVAYSAEYRNGLRYRNGAWGHTGSLYKTRAAAVVARSGTVYVVLSEGAKPASSERLFDALARLG